MIGVFDSGFGGLHVLKSITTHLQEYGYLYLGDSAHAPYGPRPQREVYEFTKRGVDFLFSRGAVLVVLACNTASSEALRKIQTEYGAEKKVLGVLIPFAEAAAARTKNRRVGVMATEGTVRSGAFVREIQKTDSSIDVFQQACPALVPLIEAGALDSPELDARVREYATPLLGKKIDTLVLGCTHYGLVEKKIRTVIGPDIEIISERDVVPERLQKYFARHPEIALRIEKSSRREFYTTGDTKKFERLGSSFFGSAIRAEHADLPR